MSKITVVGSVAFDSIETPFGKVESVLGGSATHFSAAASFFAPVNLVAVVGNDFPKEHIKFLKSRNIDTEGLEIADGNTFAWKGFYEYDLNTAHTLETKLNVFQDFEPKLPERYTNSEIVFLANIDPELQLSVLDQIDKPKLVVLDTMNFWIENKKDRLLRTLQEVDIALMNDSEARELAKTFSLLDAARMIMSWGPETVIIKKGEHGVLMFTENTHFAAPAFPLEEIKDPTGAGDSFAGGFLGYLAKNGDFSEQNQRKAVVYGSVMASFSVEDFGLNRARHLKQKEIEDRYAEFEEITGF
ncbi:MAG: sugar kinase [Actinobacteria bacterium]|nr:MAG: sugar kinase [Actinomycetota bacterium]